MSNLFKSIRKIIINGKNDQKSKSYKEEVYLSQAIDMIDLERRQKEIDRSCLLYTSPSPRDLWISRMPSSA